MPYGPTMQRFRRLALVLERQRDFDAATWQRFNVKFDELIELYESEYPMEIPPLLEIVNNEWRTQVRWPKGWHT